MKAYKQSIVDNGHLGALSNLCVLALTKSCEIGRVCSLLTEWTDVIKVLSIFPFPIQQFAWKSLCTAPTYPIMYHTILDVEKCIWNTLWYFKGWWSFERKPVSISAKALRASERQIVTFIIITDDTSAIFCPSCCFAPFCADITGPCRLLAHWLVFERPCRLMSSQLESWLALSLIYLTLCYLAILVTLRVCWIAW